MHTLSLLQRRGDFLCVRVMPECNLVWVLGAGRGAFALSPRHGALKTRLGPDTKRLFLTVPHCSPLPRTACRGKNGALYHYHTI